tara:strand:- start:51593 stop:51928 length:336 start_codon:yes stop_codon:yes gene_type:complete
VATTANIFIDQGSNYSNIITVSGTNGAALNLTGYTVASQMRKSYTSTTAYNLNASIHSAANGQVRMILNAAQSEVIPPGRYLYDLEITSGSGAKTRVVHGVATVTPQITQI